MTSVERMVRQINLSKANGPDKLPNWVLKAYADIIAPAVTDILNCSFRSSKVPYAWKLADVPLIPKVKNIADFNKNLRQIALTSSLSKIAENLIINYKLKPILLKSIDPKQFGFMPGSSTTLALISMLHNLLAETDGTCSTVRVALLDFKKAFDLVDHNLLISKLISNGIRARVVNWITDFLRNRRQRVKLGTNISSS